MKGKKPSPGEITYWEDRLNALQVANPNFLMIKKIRIQTQIKIENKTQLLILK